MPVAATNETPVVATSAMPVEQSNDTPAVATSAMPVEQANEAPVAPNNQMSMTVSPYLLGVVPNTTTLKVQDIKFRRFPLNALVKVNGNEIEIDQSNQVCFEQGPASFKWAIKHLVPPDMIETIRSDAPLEAAKLKTLVRGIRPRVDAMANPREGEPTDYVLVLGDIIQANDPKSISRHAFRTARQMFDNGKLCNYKSACICNIVHDGNGSVSLH
jgi:hypothetical protein